MDGIVRQGPVYTAAIVKSVDTAGQGCIFATDAVSFCKRLNAVKDPTQKVIDELKEALKSITQVAKLAHEGSKEMENAFRNIRVELFNVITLPNPR